MPFGTVGGDDGVPSGAGDHHQGVTGHRGERETLAEGGCVSEALGAQDARLAEGRAHDAVVICQSCGVG